MSCLYNDVKFKNVIPLHDKNFQEILRFYLFGCPVAGASCSADTFEQLGWKKESFSTLKSKMLKAASPDLKVNYFPCKKEELEKRFQQMEKLATSKEFCVFLKHDETRIMDSLYSAIRNALAHGSFTLKKANKKYIYFFANYDVYLKAQIRLHEETLLNWVKIVKNGPYPSGQKG